MRSFLLASAALCLTWGLSGCDTPTETKPVTPPAVTTPSDAPKDKMTPSDAPKTEGKMEPTTPAPADAKPAEPPK